MATVLRGPVSTRIWARDPAGVALRAQTEVTVNRLLTTLFGQDILNTIPGMVYDYDWPNPRRPVEINPNRTHIAPGGQLLLTGQDQFFGAPGQPVSNYDWPVPRGYRHTDRLSYSVSLSQVLLGPTPAVPFAQTDWPNPPRGYPYPVALRTYAMAGGQPYLLSQDAFFRGAGYVPTYDWPNPIAKTPGIALRTIAQPGGQLLLLGQDRLPFNQRDWPLPRIKPFPIETRSWIAYSTPLRAPLSQHDTESLSDSVMLGDAFTASNTWTQQAGTSTVWTQQSGLSTTWTQASPVGTPWTKQ